MRTLPYVYTLFLSVTILIACNKDPETFLENAAPVVVAVNDTTIDLTKSMSDSIRLSGSATDADGSIAGYLWSQVSGPSSSNIITSGASSTYINGLISGKYVFQLMATDNKGAVGVKAINVTIIQNGNTPPVVSAGRDTTIDLSKSLSDSIILNGTATDADGTIESYEWTQVSGPTLVQFISPTTATTKVKGITGGKYVFQLKATDNKRAVGLKTVAVIIIKNNALNIAPIVSLNSDTTVVLSSETADSVRLTGSATDLDGSIVGYLWSQISGPTTAIIRTPGAASSSFSGLTSGRYVFQLMAIDDKGLTGIKSIVVTVQLPQQVTLVLQPHQSSLDRHLAFDGVRDGSDPTATDLGAAAWTSNGLPSFVRALLKFDLSSLPNNAKITSAKLTLYSNPAPLNGNLIDANFGSNNAILLQRVTTNWNTSVTWQTQPSSDATSQIIIPHTAQSLLNIADLDVTQLIKDMQQLGNYGFLIKLQNETSYNSRIFCSSKYPDASKHPKLILQYTN